MSRAYSKTGETFYFRDRLIRLSFVLITKVLLRIDANHYIKKRFLFPIERAGFLAALFSQCVFAARVLISRVDSVFPNETIFLLIKMEDSREN